MQDIDPAFTCPNQMAKFLTL